jgi:radical SAM protein with 4Fe4S-binding SPASM domain
MDPDLIKKIASELQSIRPKLVTLHLSGEPLLHPEISRLISILKEKRLHVTFSTNGLLLTKQKIEEIIDAGLDCIRIDFAANKERYEDIRQNSVWDVVYNNILSLIEIKKKKNASEPLILLFNIDVVNNKRETTGNLHSMAKLFNKSTVKTLNLELHRWAGEFARASEEKGLYEELSLPEHVKGKYFPCPHIFGSFVITWNGDVVPCCRDLKKDYIIGNVQENSIKHLWNSEKMIELRRKQIEQKYMDIPLCRHCTMLWDNYDFLKFTKSSFQRLLFRIRGQ